MTSRAYLSSRAEGGFSDSVPSSRGEADLRLAAPPGPGGPMRAGALVRGHPPTHPPNDRSPAPGSSRPAAVPRRRRVLTWIPRSPGLRSAGGEGGRAGAQHRLSPCPQETPPAIPKLSLHQHICGF